VERHYLFVADPKGVRERKIMKDSDKSRYVSHEGEFFEGTWFLKDVPYEFSGGIDIKKDKKHGEVTYPHYGGNSIQYIGPWKVLIDDTGNGGIEKFLSGFYVDIIVFKNSEKGWAGVIFSETKYTLHWSFDVLSLHKALETRGESWRMPTKDKVICGGPDEPEAKTTITSSELFMYVQRSLRLGEVY